MNIKGLQKTTLLDFPGKVACTVFTGGCNLRCPFCHNALLVTRTDEAPEIYEDVFFSFLEKRRGILDGVCITGGEPLLQRDIIPFINKINTLGFAVKLDTNGFFPEVLEKIISGHLVEYIAMDIKNSIRKYTLTAGTDRDCSVIQKSISLIMNGDIPYEFRTTVVKELHTPDDIEEIAKMIEGAPRYYLQAFKDSGDLLSTGLSAYGESEMLGLRDLARPHVGHCEVRGI